MTLTEQQKTTLIVTGILGVSIFIIIVYFMFAFINPAVSDARATSETLQTEIRKNRETLAEYQRYLDNEEAHRELRERFRTIEARLPSEQDPFAVFSLLREYFEGSNVFFSFLDPGDMTDRGRFREFPFTIRGSADYHAFGQLVNLIECNPDRLMHVTSIRLTNSERSPSIHPMEVGIATFTFDEE